MQQTGGESTTDIFWWANQADARKQQLNIELFLFSKNYTLYRMPLASELNAQLKPLFLFDYINQVTLGAGTGLTVQDYETGQTADQAVLRVDLDKVSRAETLLYLIEQQPQDIVEFSEVEHEFKRMKGVVARFTDPQQPDNSFYTVKLLQTARALPQALAWQFQDGRFEPFQAEVGFRVPDDNQVLIIKQDIFVFQPNKFERLFGYDYKKQLIADQKVADIQQRYRLSFPEGVDLASLVRDRKKTITKLQKLELGDMTQEQVLSYADDMQLDLMSDDSGAIIIMDGNDLDTFVNLINEDYVESQLTGRRYEIRSKKLLGEPEGEPPRG